MNELFETEIESGSKCSLGHPISLVAEGYGICREDIEPVWWYAWRLTPPLTGGWYRHGIQGRDGNRIDAWVELSHSASKADAIAYIQKDIAAHRSLPFDEAAERARLMPV